MEIHTIDQSFVGAKSIFYIEGSVVGEEGKHRMINQMFVEAYFPKQQMHPYPVIMFHGAGQTNVNWLITPDGRMGWADYFVSKGYAVYLCEQPSRGRSAYYPEDNGPRMYHSIEALQNFMADHGSWPQARLHTQWPGAGTVDLKDESDRQFVASQVEYLVSNKDSQKLTVDCALKLLEKIGPAILLTHSQAGPFGWLIADRKPDLVKAVVALEPGGPTFSRNLDVAKATNYGLADWSLHYEPEIKGLEDFHLKLLRSDTAERISGWVLEEPAPKLVNLAGIPIWLVTSEASYHAQYDYLMDYLLTECGVDHQFVQLGEAGIHGNSHMMMLEKNNLEIADLILSWLDGIQ